MKFIAEGVEVRVKARELLGDARPATTRIHSPWDDLHLGQLVTIKGREYRITRAITERAPEDDPEMGILAGDPVTTFEFTPADKLSEAIG